MCKKMFLSAVLALFVYAATGIAGAVSVFDIEYPVAELGGCADRLMCKAYCDDPQNENACAEWGKKYGLLDARAIETKKKVEEQPGPGGCASAAACREYCADPDHAEECNDAAAAQGLITEKEAEQNKKLANSGPGGCRGEACRRYCDDSAHREECLEFSLKNGFITRAEYERVKEQAERLENIKDGPGGCASPDECRTYCEDSSHVDECLEFSKKNGFVSEEEAARIKKAGIGSGPGGCKGKDECRAYCEDSNHTEECVDFAEKNGFMSSEEAARARKFANQTGPGGCRGEACKAFCDDEKNTEVCLAHAEKEGLIDKEEIARIKKFVKATAEGGPGGCRGTECRAYCENAEHQDECFAFAKTQGLIRPEEERGFEAGKKIKEAVKEKGGPGGCRNDEECRAYCSDSAHVEECVVFGAAHSGASEEDVRGMIRNFTQKRMEGRGEFKSEEEFKKIEQSFRERFQEFKGGQGGEMEIPMNSSDGGTRPFPNFPGKGPEGGEFPGKGMPRPFFPSHDRNGAPMEGIGPLPGTRGFFDSLRPYDGGRPRQEGGEPFRGRPNTNPSFEGRMPFPGAEEGSYPRSQSFPESEIDPSGGMIQPQFEPHPPFSPMPALPGGSMEPSSFAPMQEPEPVLPPVELQPSSLFRGGSKFLASIAEFFFGSNGY